MVTMSVAIVVAAAVARRRQLRWGASDAEFRDDLTAETASPWREQ
jgi:hypothetical protein